MRRSAFVIPVFAIALSCKVLAQEPALPSQPMSPPDRNEQINPSPSPSAPPLLAPVTPPDPAAAAPTPAVPADLRQLDAAFKRTPLSQLSEEYRLHVEWKQLQNRAVNDPRVIEAKAAANRARTDLEKRERLRAYYNVYYGRMLALTSSPQMKVYLNLQKKAHLATLAQPRVRPEGGRLPQATLERTR